MAITDLAGRTLSVPFDPDRIVCLGPGTLRLIVYLQAESKVAGVEAMEKRFSTGRPYWMAHPELQKLPSCGPGGPAGIGKKPDGEAILGVKPQIVFSTFWDAGMADEVQKLLGVPVVVLSYGALATFEDNYVADSLMVAGKILNREKRAEEVVGFIESLKKDLNQRTADIPPDQKPGVYVGGLGFKGIMGIESTDKRFLPFHWVHAKNLADTFPATMGSHVMVDKEAFLKLNPDIIFLDLSGLPMVIEDMKKKPEYYQALKAFSDRNVFTLLPFNWYTTNIGTALADSFAIGKILYEKRFEDLDPAIKADEIYTFLVGKPVYEQMSKDFGPLGVRPDFLH